MKGMSSTLFSFVVNNSSKERIRVLIWGEKAKEYVGQIQLRKVSNNIIIMVFWSNFMKFLMILRDCNKLKILKDNFC